MEKSRYERNLITSIETHAPKVRKLMNTVYSGNKTANSVTVSDPDVLMNGTKLCFADYSRPCILLAKYLLGKILTRKLSTGEILQGRIVEAECYLGVDDKACHSYKGKVTERNSAMFMPPGTAYVYNIYGMYCCFNISSLEEGSAVLIRSLEPLAGHATMRTLRSLRRKNAKAVFKDRDLCNGPSKLCQALVITKELLNKEDLSVSDSMWVEKSNECDVPEEDIVISRRIGIESAGEECSKRPLRFYVRNSNFVSVRDKTVERTSNC